MKNKNLLMSMFSFIKKNIIFYQNIVKWYNDI